MAYVELVNRPEKIKAADIVNTEDDSAE
jgi:hypothetical protein